MKEKFLEKVTKLIEEIDTLKQKSAHDIEFKKWFHTVSLIFKSSSEDNPYFLEAFSKIRFLPVIITPGAVPETEYNRILISGLNSAYALLSTFKEMIIDFSEDDDQSEKTLTSSKSAEVIKNENIFIVHGQNELIKTKLARFLENLGLKPIILHEKPNEGKTIIEKFEKHSEVEIAICLWTSDDLGKLNNQEDHLVPRARQNVIFETGFFIGKLGRSRVLVLIDKDIEMPSDYSGVLYIEIDDKESWQFHVAREMKNIGFSIDLNKMVN